MWLSVEHKDEASGTLVVGVHDGDEKEEVSYVREDIVEVALRYAAVDMEAVGCTDPWCVPCNPGRRAWWDACNALSVRTRIELQKLLRETNVALPLGGFENE